MLSQTKTRLLQPEKLNDEQLSTIEKLCQLFPQIEQAKQLTQEFIRIVRERSSNQFNGWLRAAMQSMMWSNFSGHETLARISR